MDRVQIRNRFELFNGSEVFVSGAVKRPGSFNWEAGMTVKDLILLAGGFKKNAEYGRLRLETPVPEDSTSTVEWLSLDSALRSESSDKLIEPGAHLAIPVNPHHNDLEMVDVRGWVVRPGAYALLRADERLSEVLERAGGLRSGGYLDGARLLRGETGGARIQIEFAKALAAPGGKDDLKLRPGDVIDVPNTPATIEIRGRVNNPGHVVWVEGKTWKWYVQQVGGLSDSAWEDGIYVQYAEGSVQTVDDGIRRKPNPDSVIVVPFRKPADPVKLTDVLSGVNVILATVIAGLTIMVLMRQ
jgi:protein involved in polysaccharide export with SLBB domain